ncbi:MAG TPA: IPT/TIG domain-containing protein [Acidimicrobiales bacterium]|nr:IPT/TIG domain-containing protein [Acidimicrobiales bacterium]
MIVLAVIWAAAGMSAIGPSAAAETPTLTAVEPSSGPSCGGTAVVLTGTGFGQATGVRFGTDPAASFWVDSDTRITAVSPAHAAAADVDVTITTAAARSAVTPEGRYSWYEGAWSRSDPEIDGPVRRSSGHQAVALADGRVLVVGGRTTETGREEATSATAEIYNPASRTWSATGSMATAQVDFTATLLPDGKVLLPVVPTKGPTILSATAPIRASPSPRLSCTTRLSESGQRRRRCPARGIATQPPCSSTVRCC